MVYHKIVFLLCIIILGLFFIDGASIMTKHSSFTVGSRGASSRSLDDSRISALRERGKHYIQCKNYKRAAQCYSAILQLVEGIGGTATLELRRRCGLTLAECEIKVGNLQHAVARCSEVINETPELSFSDSKSRVPAGLIRKDTEHAVKQAIGKAYYRRGVSMKRLNKPFFALLDFEESLRYIPGDAKVNHEIALLRTNTDGLEEDQEEDLKDRFIDLIEECQCDYPRAFYTESQITSLCGFLSEYSGSKGSSSHSNSRSNSFKISKRKAGTSSSLPAAGINPFAGAARGGFGDMTGGLGGIGGMLGGLTGSSGSKNILEQVKGMLRMFGPMIGLDANTSQTLVEIIDAVASVGKLYKKTMATLQKYKSRLVLVLTAAWVLSCAIPIIRQYLRSP